MKRVFLAVAGGLLCSHSAAILAQSTCTAGQVDTRFGTAHNGYVQISPVVNASVAGEAEIIDGAGASYSVSTAAADSGGNPIPDIIKVRSDGARDLSFGGFGSVVPPPSGLAAVDATLTGDSAGNLLIAVVSADQTTIDIYRYSAAGALDASYGSAGIASIPLAGATGPWAIEATSDGSVLVATSGFPNSSSSRQPVVFKVTPAGALDTSFGASGFSYFYTGAFGPFGKATDLSVQSDGSILVGGRVGDPNSQLQFFVARLLGNGVLDSSFGTSAGMTAVSFGTGVLADGRKLAVQSDGKIVIVGGMGVTGNDGTGVIRLTASGSPDPTFNGTGSLVLAGIHGYQVALQNNDKILIAGTQSNAQQTVNNAIVVRLTTSGQFDPAFGPAQNGIVTLAVPGAVNSGTSNIAFRTGSGIHVRVQGLDATQTISTDYLLRLDAGTGSGCH